MKKKYLILMICLVVLALIILIAGCAKGPEQIDQDITKPETEALPSMLAMGTHPIGTLFNALGSGLATVASQNTPIEVKAIATSGPVEWFPMFKTKEMDMGVLNCWDAQMGWLGKVDYEGISEGKGFPVRLLTNGSFALNSAIVAEDSGIKTAQDLKDKRYVGVYTGAAGITAQARAFLANHNLTEADVKIISVPGVNDGIKAIIEKRADVSGSAVTGMAVVEELQATRGARFLNYDPSPEAVKRMQKEFPGYIIEVKPGPTGVREATFMMAYDIYLVSRTDLSDEAAYTIVKALWEHNEELGPIHPRLKDWNTERFVTERATIPYHPGAIKFYKEKGLWNDKMETLQKELLSKGQ